MGANSGLMDYLPLVLIVVCFYFLIIRPQQQRAKRQREMLDGIVEGNEVATSGGILGKVISVSGAHVHLEIAPNVEILVQKAAITTLLPPGTMDAPEQLPPTPPSCCA